MFEMLKLMFEMLKYKKAQLGGIEATYFFYGLFAGLAIGLVVTILAARGTIPLGFIKSLVCGAVTKGK